jgi:hypothetical protein
MNNAVRTQGLALAASIDYWLNYFDEARISLPKQIFLVMSAFSIVDSSIVRVSSFELAEREKDYNLIENYGWIQIVLPDDYT